MDNNSLRHDACVRAVLVKPQTLWKRTEEHQSVAYVSTLYRHRFEKRLKRFHLERITVRHMSLCSL